MFSQDQQRRRQESLHFKPVEFYEMPAFAGMTIKLCAANKVVGHKTNNGVNALALVMPTQEASALVTLQYSHKTNNGAGRESLHFKPVEFYEMPACVGMAIKLINLLARLNNGVSNTFVGSRQS